MACNRWESDGLLLTSDELSATKSKSFKMHMGECADCHDEYHSYINMKDRFFTPEFLQFNVPESLDIFPLNDNASPKRMIVWGMPFFSFLQYRVAPAFILTLGIFIGYSMLPTNDSEMVNSPQSSQIHSSTKEDSLHQKPGDTLRQFHEGGSSGIRSVDVTE